MKNFHKYKSLANTGLQAPGDPLRRRGIQFDLVWTCCTVSCFERVSQVYTETPTSQAPLSGQCPGRYWSENKW